MKTRLVPVLVILLLFTAACGSKTDKTKTAKSDASTSTSASESTTTTAGATAGGAATTVKGGATATTVKGATATTTKATSSNGAPTPATPGTYDYAQSGTSSVGSIPATGSLKVDPANASGVQIWHEYDDPSQPPSDTTMAFRADGPFLVETVQRAAGMTITCHFDAPIPAPPWPATVGKKLSGHANCGQLTADVAGSITAHKTATIDGKSIDVVVLQITVTTHGQIESTSNSETWWAPSLRIDVHDHTTTNGKFGAFAFTSDVTRDLKSGVPH